MTRMLRLLFMFLSTVAFVPVAEAGPIVYFDSYRSLNVNGTLFENTTTGGWSASDPGPGTIRSHSSIIGQTLFAGDGSRSERITASGNLNAFSSDGPMNVSTDLFTSFALDAPHPVNLAAFVSTRDYGHAEGLFYNETTQMVLAQAAVNGNNFLQLRYQGVLEPGVYSYYLLAQINTGGGFHQSRAQFGGDLTLIPPAPVPEPATMTLLATGLIAAWRARRKPR